MFFVVVLPKKIDRQLARQAGIPLFEVESQGAPENPFNCINATRVMESHFSQVRRKKTDGIRKRKPQIDSL